MSNTNLNSLMLKTDLVGDVNLPTAADRIGAGFGVVADLPLPMATFLSQGRSQQPRLSSCKRTTESYPGSTVGQQEQHVTWRAPFLPLRLKPSRSNRASYLEPTAYPRTIDCDCQSLDDLRHATGSPSTRLRVSRWIASPFAAKN